MSGKKRTVSASPTAKGAGANDGVRAGLLRHASAVLVSASDLTERPLTERWAIRYLESSRGLGPAPAPLSPADQAKMSYAQAELMVHVITTVLDGLELSWELWDKGGEIAMRELKAASEEGWSPP
jgi:hypothetical protein